MAELTDREERTVETPFGVAVGAVRHRHARAASGWPSWRGTAPGTGCCPSELNFRANIFGFKMLGVEYILSASAVGSLKERYRPLDLVIPDQFFDRTKGRDLHVLRPRAGRARRLRAPVLPAARRRRL